MSDVQTEASTQADGEEEGVFECEVCGSSESARVVPYDRLGYPVCPVCGHPHGPALVAARGR